MNYSDLKLVEDPNNKFRMIAFWTDTYKVQSFDIRDEETPAFIRKQYWMDNE